MPRVKDDKNRRTTTLTVQLPDGGDLDDVDDDDFIEVDDETVTTRRRRSMTAERVGFVEGLFEELDHQLDHHLKLVQATIKLETQRKLNERNLIAARDHIYAVLSDTDYDVPTAYAQMIGRVRFIGKRLSAACLQVLKEQGTISTTDLLDQLNRGQFRFRTGAPLREIHAALIKHGPLVTREGNYWVYHAPEAAVVENVEGDNEEAS